MLISFVSITVSWMTLLAQTLSVQASPPLYKSEIELVEVAARVVDRDRKPVLDLEENDFEVRENGVQQSIAIFQRVRIPVQDTNGSENFFSRIPSHVATNDFPVKARTFLILLDDIHIDSRRTVALSSLLRGLIERHIGGQDIAALVSTSGAPAQDFTTDRARMLEAVDRARGLRRGADAFLDPVQDARSLSATIEGLAKQLSERETHRVTLLLISEGIDFNIYDVNDPKATDVVRAIEQAIRALRRADVTLYAVDPRGLAVAEEDVFGKRDRFVNPLPNHSMKGTATPLTAPDENEILRNSLQFLSHISTSTGGFALINSNEYDKPFSKILEEASSYYVLGYYPTARAKAGEVRNIDIKVRRPDLEVYARRGYVRPRMSAEPSPSSSGSKLSPAIAAELERAVPSPNLPLRAQAIPLGETGKRARVQLIVEVAGRDIQLRSVAGSFRETLEFGVLTIDERGRRGNGKSATINLALTEDQMEVLKRTGLRWLTSLDVGQGHYGVRVAVHGLETGRTGSVFAECDVPKFNADPVLSPIAMTSLPASLTLTVGSGSLIPQLGGPPTVSRTFVIGDVIQFTAPVYPGRVQATYHGLAELSVRKQTESHEEMILRRTIDVTRFSDGSYHSSFRVETTSLGVGHFVVQIRLSAGKDGPEAAQLQATEFEVVGHR